MCFGFDSVGALFLIESIGALFLIRFGVPSTAAHDTQPSGFAFSPRPMAPFPGAALYAQKRYVEAVAAWDRALAPSVHLDPETRAQIETYREQARLEIR